MAVIYNQLTTTLKGIIQKLNSATLEEDIIPSLLSKIYTLA
jgi:hypothetical protein